MLTPDEVRATRADLQENYRRLSPKREDVLADHSANRWFPYDTPWRDA